MALKIFLLLFFSFSLAAAQSDISISQSDTNRLIKQALLDYHKINGCCGDSVFCDAKLFDCPIKTDSLKVICFDATDMQFKKQILRKYKSVSFMLIKNISFKDDDAYVTFGDGLFTSIHKQDNPDTYIVEYTISYKVDKVNKTFTKVRVSGGLGN